jgi:Clp amino terminal domain, pathogenicity island component
MTRIDDVRLISELLTTAEQEARAAGDEQPGAEHLLLAACITGDDTARVALERWDASPDRIRAAIESVHAQALASIGLPGASSAPITAQPTGVYRSDANAQRVFTRAGELARRRRPKGSSYGARPARRRRARGGHGTSRAPRARHLTRRVDGGRERRPSGRRSIRADGLTCPPP